MAGADRGRCFVGGAVVIIVEVKGLVAPGIHQKLTDSASVGVTIEPRWIGFELRTVWAGTICSFRMTEGECEGLARTMLDAVAKVRGD